MAPTEQTAPALFANLSRLVYTGTSYEEIFQHLVDVAPALVSGCDHASLMLTGKEGYARAASSDDVALACDALERAVGEGPCLDAIEDEPGQVDADLARHSSWSRLSERILAETSVRGMAGFRIMVEGRKVGALNLFSDTPGAIEAGADEGAVLAAFASVALRAVANQERVESLLVGLETNREVGKAIGLLMAAHRIGSDEAFDLLRKASNDMNIKLIAVAQEVIDNAERRPDGPPPPE
ncbi:MAG: GAF and ANTAR domain-containing protein [Nocardioides sp.]